MTDLDPKRQAIRAATLAPEAEVLAALAQAAPIPAEVRARAAEVGAYEYLPKPFDLKELLGQVSRALSRKTRRAPAAEEESPREENLPLIGRSPAMQEVYRVMARLMTTDLTVMIWGESGTGKELVARALHEYGRREHGPFVALNMAAVGVAFLGLALVVVGLLLGD